MAIASTQLRCLIGFPSGRPVATSQIRAALILASAQEPRPIGRERQGMGRPSELVDPPEFRAVGQADQVDAASSVSRRPGSGHRARRPWPAEPLLGRERDLEVADLGAACHIPGVEDALFPPC